MTTQEQDLQDQTAEKLDDTVEEYGLIPSAEGNIQPEAGKSSHISAQKRRRNIVKTLVLYYLAICQGMGFFILGTTIVDLQLLTSMSTSQSIDLFTGHSFGALAGAVVSFLLANYVDNTVLIVYSSLVTGIAVCITPFLRSLAALIAFCVLFGFHALMVDACSNSVMLQIWMNDNNSWFIAFYACFAIGVALEPLLSKSFLAKLLEAKNGTHDNINTTQTALQEMEVLEADYSESHVHQLYLILGVGVCLGGLLLGCLHLYDRYHDKDQQENKTKAKEQPAVTSPRSRFKYFIAIALFGFYIILTSIQETFTNFLMTYITEQLAWSTQTGANILSLYGLASCLAAFLNIFLCRFFSPRLIIIVSTLVIALSQIVVFIFIDSFPNILWVSSVVLGAAFTCIFSNGMLWTGENIHISEAIGTMFILASSSGEMISPFVRSFVYKAVGVHLFTYSCLFISCLIFLYALILTTVAHRFKPPTVQSN